MGILDWVKKKAGQDTEVRPRFQFRIDDIFKIKGHGVVVTGQVVLGSARKGDAVSYGPAPGTVTFPCSIGEIEQPDPATRKPCHPQEARADGPYRGSYAFLIPGHSALESQPGCYLFK